MIIKTRRTLLTSWNWSRDGRLLCLPLPLTCPWPSSQCSVNTENALNKPSDLSQADLCWHSGSLHLRGDGWDQQHKAFEIVTFQGPISDFSSFFGFYKQWDVRKRLDPLFYTWTVLRSLLVTAERSQVSPTGDHL